MNIINSTSINAYRFLRATASQSGTDAPIILVFENNLKFTLTFTRIGVGSYKITFSSLLYINKLLINFGSGLITLSSFDGNSIQFNTYTIADGVPPTLADDLLTNTAFELIYYA
jgi:hypothetical protein